MIKTHWNSPYCSCGPSLSPHSHLYERRLNIREVNLVKMTTAIRATTFDSQYQDLSNISKLLYFNVWKWNTKKKISRTSSNTYGSLHTCVSESVSVMFVLSGYVGNWRGINHGVKDWKRTNPCKVTVLFWACWVSNLFWSLWKVLYSWSEYQNTALIHY